MLDSTLGQGVVFDEISACENHKDLFWDERLAFDPRHPHEETMQGTRRLTNREIDERLQERSALEQKALSVCHSCSNLSACREFSLREEVFGVSGGMTQSERDALRAPQKDAVVDPKKFAASAKRSESRRKRAALTRKEAKAKAIIATACKAKEIPFRPEGLEEVIAYYKTSGKLPRVDEIPYAGPKKVSIPALDAGRPVSGPALLNAVTARIYDVLSPGSTLSASDLIQACSDLISDEAALHYWLETPSQPTADDSIRVIPGSYAKTSVSKRLSAGRARCVMVHLGRAVRNQTVSRLGDSDYRIAESALISWAQFREIQVSQNAA